MDKSQQCALWYMFFLDAPEEEVPIEGVVKLKSIPISNYKVRLAYGDLTLIIAMIHDYIKDLDDMNADGTLKINKIEYEAYYRKKFLEIADRISEQIEYDYDKQLAKCLKKLKKQSHSDIGEDAMVMAVKQGWRAKPPETSREDSKDNGENKG